MTKSSLPNSVRKFLRKEKARIRRMYADEREAEQKIRELAAKTVAQYTKHRKPLLK